MFKYVFQKIMVLSKARSCYLLVIISSSHRNYDSIRYIIDKPCLWNTIKIHNLTSLYHTGTSKHEIMKNTFLHRIQPLLTSVYIHEKYRPLPIKTPLLSSIIISLKVTKHFCSDFSECSSSDSLEQRLHRNCPLHVELFLKEKSKHFPYI